jgi:transposase
MNAISLSQLLLNTDQLIVKELMIGTDKIGLAVESTAHKAACPKCQEESTQIHSTYMRYPADLAWAEWAVVLHLRVKRFFCKNEACPKKTFAERFPDLVAQYARRTERATERQHQICLNVCARIAEKLLMLDRIGISDTTINRLIRSLPDPDDLPVRVLGLDDWAKRKGQRYGTILVDLERGEIIDLLGDRNAETVAQWLEEHPEIEIVSRDRSQTYANAISQGAPDAIQVADRWHLLKNISDAVFKILQQEYATIKQRMAPAQEQDQQDCYEGKLPETLLPDDAEEQLTPAEERRKERIICAQKLQRQGWTQKGIAQHLDIHPKTVRRYLQDPSPRARRYRTGQLLNAYKPYLVQRWNEGCHNATQLFREIQQQGYAGKTTMVRNFVQHLRQISQDKPINLDPSHRVPSLRELTWFILKRPEKRTDEDEKTLTLLSTEHPKLTTTIKLSRELAAIIREQDVSDFDVWLEKASKSHYRVWNNFAASIRQDYDAVRSAILLQWSNGPTEGHINRLKCLKRQMYGRAKDDLLRKRVLWQGRWSFT